MQRVLLLILITFIMTVSLNAQTSKEIDFAKRLVDVFKSKNFGNYKQFIPTKADFEALYKDTGLIRGLRVNTDEKYKKAIETYEKNVDSSYKAEFNRLLKKGDKLGVDWTQITFLKLVSHKNKSKNSNKTFLSGYINFKYQDTIYVLFGLEAMEITGDYKINMIRTVQKGRVGQYVDPDLLNDGDL